jgi:hypothetical protein
MDTTAKSRASARVKRTPVTERSILTVKGKEPGYTYRIVNDTGDRVAQFQETGYELVAAKDVKVGDRRIEGNATEGSVAQISVGQGVKAVVMRQKDEYYQEDFAAKQARVDELEATTKRNATSGTYGKLEITRQ